MADVLTLAHVHLDRKELRAHPSVPCRRALAPGCVFLVGKALLAKLCLRHAPGDHRLRRALVHHRWRQHVGRGRKSWLLGR